MDEWDRKLNDVIDTSNAKFKIVGADGKTKEVTREEYLKWFDEMFAMIQKLDNTSTLH